MVIEIINIIGAYLSGMFIGLLIVVPTGYDKRYFEQNERYDMKHFTISRRESEKHDKRRPHPLNE